MADAGKNLLADEAPVGRNLLAEEAPAIAPTAPSPSRGEQLGTKIPEERQPKKSKFVEGIKETGKAAGAGGVIGAFTPQIAAGIGAGLSAFPPTAPLGAGVLSMVPAMQATSMASRIGTGMLGAAGGEAAGQVAEAYGAPWYAKEVISLAAGGVTPEFANLIKWGGGKAVGMTGLATKSDISSLVSSIVKDAGLDERQLSPSQRKYIESVANQIRGGARTEDFAKKTYSFLERGATDIVDNYNFQASNMQRQAQELLDAAATTGAVRTAEAERRIATLASQFEASSQNLTKLAEARADTIIKNANAAAEKMRLSSAARGRGEREFQEMEARNVIQQGRAEADKILSDSRERVTRLREIAGRARQTGAARQEAARGKLASVGEAQTSTQTGTSIRDAVMPVFENLKKVRSDNAEKLKGDAFNFAAMKEQKGIMPKDTESFKKGMAELDKLIADTTLSDIKAPLQRIRNALDPVRVEEGVVIGKPAKFESLEQVRRFLRDRSYGLPAEGFDAINQQQSGRLADMIEGIQTEFSPGIAKFLDQYRKDSEPLRLFKTRLGEAIVGKEEFDMARFTTDPATLGSKFFKSETGVKDLVNLLGGDASKAESIARGYVADQLRDATAAQVKTKISAWRDWLPQFPGVQNQLQQAAATMEQAERVGAKRVKLSDVLRTEARTLPLTAERAATRVESDIEKRAAALEAQGRKAEADILRKQEQDIARTTAEAEREAGRAVKGTESQIEASGRAVERQKSRIQTEAERAAKGELTAAEREAAALRTEAGKLSSEGEKIRQQILGKSFPARRVQEIILSGDKKLWGEIGPILAKDPEAKEAFVQAVRQVVADKATMSPRSVVDSFVNDIRPAIESTGLMTPRQLASLQGEIEKINQTVSGPQRINLMQRVITNALTAEAARGVVGAGNLLYDGFNTMRTLTGKK